MPYKSRAQQGWAHTPQGQEALGGPSAVKEWDRESRGKKLPQKVSGTKPSRPLQDMFRKGAKLSNG